MMTSFQSSFVDHMICCLEKMATLVCALFIFLQFWVNLLAQNAVKQNETLPVVLWHGMGKIFFINGCLCCRIYCTVSVFFSVMSRNGGGRWGWTQEW